MVEAHYNSVVPSIGIPIPSPSVPAPSRLEVVQFLKSANAAVSIDEALSLGRVEPKRGEGQCGLRLFDLG